MRSVYSVGLHGIHDIAWQHDLLTHLIHRVPGRSAGLLSTHVVLDDDVLRSEGVVRAIHGRDPIIRPPVLEVGREEMTKYLICSMHHTSKQMYSKFQTIDVLQSFYQQQ